MKITLKITDPSKLVSDILVSFCFENDLISVLAYPANLSQIIKTAASDEQFTGKAGEYIDVDTGNIIAANKLHIEGIGKKDEFSISSIYKAVGSAVKHIRRNKPLKIALLVPEYWFFKITQANAVKVIAESLYLSTYSFDKYKSEDERKKQKKIEEAILIVHPSKLAIGEEGLKLASVNSRAVFLARDLINEPPTFTTPTNLAETALQFEKQTKKAVTVKILEKEEAEKMGMEAFLGVARGSAEPPKFIILRYKPPGATKKVVLIGKGITFDTGGLSIKSAEHMETMKQDMAGAAAILGIFSVLDDLKPRIEVVGIVAACENMPSGRALKPGDILRAMNGKTIEVLNTDAEGRLTLADAISYANIKEKPDEIIDVATLTGACMVALGQDIAGLFGNNEKLLSKIEDIAKITYEKVWRLPLEEDYKKLLKSHIADFKNIQTGRYGGAISAALFLSEFVGNTPWVHLDIAGPGYLEQDTLLAPRGGSGYGVRMLLHYLSS